MRSAACLEYISKCAVPVVGWKDDDIGVFGTRALFRIGSVSCLVTAAHVIDEVKKAVSIYGLGLPLPSSSILGPHGCADRTGEFDEAFVRVAAPGLVQIAWSQNAADDLCALILHSADKVQELAQNYAFLDAECIVPAGAQVERYWVFGYPRGATLAWGGSTRWRRYHFNPPRLPGTPAGVAWDPPADPNVNTFFGPPDNVFNEHDEPVKHPDLHGISGCLVWAEIAEEPGTGVWHPERQLRVAGLQTSCSTGKCLIRTTNALAVHALLAGIVDSMREQGGGVK